MKALILIAHGSKKQESNDEFISLVENLEKEGLSSYDEIKAVFLEIAKPDMSTVVEELINKKITEITVYPYFLNSGKHVIVDIPNQIENEKSKYPNIKFNLLNHFGSSSKIVDIIKNDVQD